jgi:hypothetical protein
VGRDDDENALARQAVTEISPDNRVSTGLEAFPTVRLCTHFARDSVFRYAVEFARNRRLICLLKRPTSRSTKCGSIPGSFLLNVLGLFVDSIQEVEASIPFGSTKIVSDF